MKRLYRSRRNRHICGLCGGLAEYFDIDPTIVRLGTTVASILTGIMPMVIAYVIAVLIVPNEDDDSNDFNVVR